MIDLGRPDSAWNSPKHVGKSGAAEDLDPWFLEKLVCPVTHEILSYDGQELVSASGHRYPVVDGVPVMLVQDERPTHYVTEISLARAREESNGGDRDDPLYLASLGITEVQKAAAAAYFQSPAPGIDPVVSYLLAATSGGSYKALVGNRKLKTYPIPDLRLPQGDGRFLLEVGCNWGRWCIAAANKGYRAAGIDPSLGGVMAGRRVARQLGLDVKLLVGDARYLPFRTEAFDVVFSYSVLQHLSRDDVRRVLAEVARVLQPGGRSLIQMAHWLGIRSMYHLIRRRFREGDDFDVRYWSFSELQHEFSQAIGRSEISVDCYFGLGLQAADAPLLPSWIRGVIHTSEALRRLSRNLRWLRRFADSVYVDSRKPRVS